MKLLTKRVSMHTPRTVRYKELKGQQAKLAGGIFSTLISNVLANNRVSQAVAETNEAANQAIKSMDSLTKLAESTNVVDSSLAQFVNAYVKERATQLGGSPINYLTHGVVPRIYLSKDLNCPVCDAPQLYATGLLSGGFLDGLKSVAKKVVSTVAKVADVPILGTALKAIPGVGTALSLASDANKILSVLPDSSTSSNESTPQQTAEVVTPVEQSTVVNAVNSAENATSTDNAQANQVAALTTPLIAAQSIAATQQSQSTDSAAAPQMAEMIPPTMESVTQLKEARLNGSSLLKNAAVLGYALKGAPSIDAADAAEYVVSISAIPAQSALAQGLKLDPQYGVWKKSDFTISLLPGVTATDMTAALSSMLSITRMGAEDPISYASSDNSSVGMALEQAALGAAYFSAAVPFLASVGDFSTINSFASSVAATVKPEIANIIAAHCAEYTAPTASTLANYIIVSLILAVKKNSSNMTDDEATLLSDLRTLGSSVLTRATAADIDAINLCLPVPLSLAYYNLTMGDLWTTPGDDEQAKMLAYASSPAGSALIDEFIYASPSKREQLITQIPSTYRSIVRDAALAYDKEGETGVSKVLSSIGSYLKSTLNALIN